MLLANSISNTKKFFRRTFQNFKSLFSSEYHRLPKTHSPLIHHSHPELEKLNNTDKLDSEKEKKKKPGRRISQEREEYHHHQSPIQKNKKKMKQVEKRDNERKNMMISHKKGRHEDSDLDSDSAVRNCMVERKLKELEKLDVGNVEYVLDIEEVLHYYSRLTCPAYLEIVDSFFMQMYSEFFVPLPKLPLPNQ